MAKAKSAGGGSRRKAARALLVILVAVVAIVGIGLWSYREPLRGYAAVGTSYAARVACSCRFVAGRSLEDCEKDKLAGMELVTLVDDPAARSVTARFPLVTANTATYREGYGCVLEEWQD
jgi:hypothetical protein